MRLNGAACALKLENYPRVEELCSEVLMTCVDGADVFIFPLSFYL
jgi:hypothetical protein